MDEKKRFEVAFQCRNMEIDLFWKRSSFYCVFVGAALVAYYTARTEMAYFGLMIASFGLVASFAWLLGSIGSKWWIENWERKVEESAPAVVGDLFSVSDEHLKRNFGVSPIRFSVTRLAILLSAFGVVLWVVIFMSELFRHFGSSRWWPAVAIAAGAIIFVILFFACARGGNRTKAGKQP